MSFHFNKIPNFRNFTNPYAQIRRRLSIQENYSYKILNEQKINTPRYGVAKSADDADKIARDLLTKNLMVKAQVLAGGRGLGKFQNGFKGGVHPATR
jgi:succinyl-CoA synthetase beta subunit